MAIGPMQQVWRYTVVGFALSFLLSGSALTKSEMPSSDIRCLIAAIQISQSSDSKAKEAGTVMAVYYLGRLDGAANDADLEKRLPEEARKETPSSIRNDIVACDNFLAERGKALVDIGAKLQR